MADLLRLVGVVYLIEKYHKAFGDGCLESGGITATESVMLVHECHSQIMPRLMADLTKPGRGPRGGSQHAERVHEVIRKHVAIINNNPSMMTKLPNLKQVGISINEIVSCIDLAPGKGNGSQSAAPATAPPTESRNVPNELHRSPFVNRRN
jgi:hypothetical protein